MNYYNPYFSYIPYGINQTTPNIFKRLTSGINFRSILSGTQKTLNFVNQLIPTIKQITPIVRNAKTMFNVMNEFKKSDKNTSKATNNISKTNENIFVKKNNAPTFFI